MLNKKSWFILIFLFFLFCFFPILKTKEVSATNFIPQVTIPGSSFQAGTSTKIENSTKPIGEYIISVYNYLIAIVGLVAAIVLMLAGVIWLTAGGSPDKVGQAKNLIAGSLTGLVLVLVSYVMLKTINPGLVEFKITEIDKIHVIEMGCCKLEKNTDKYNKIQTQTMSAYECYTTAIKLKETGIEEIETLKEKQDKGDWDGDIQKYMVDRGKFFPNKVSSEFTKCVDTGSCFLPGPTDENTIYCIKTIKKECPTQFLFTTKLTCTEKKDTYQKTLNELLTKFNLPNKNIDDYKIIYSQCEGINDGKSPSPPVSLEVREEWGLQQKKNLEVGYCYNNLCYIKEGNLGDPCGDDGGICVFTGPLTCKVSGYSGRETRGGRSCYSKNLKCCYND